MFEGRDDRQWYRCALWWVLPDEEEGYWEVAEQSGGQNGALSARSGDADWEQLKERDGPTFAATLRAKCSWTGRRQGMLFNHILSTEHTEMRRSCEVRPWV